MSPLTPAWLEKALGLAAGSVLDLQYEANTTFLSTITHVQAQYAPHVPASVPRRLVLKQTHNPREVIFQQHFAAHTPHTIPCYEAIFTEKQGHLLLADLSATHFEPPPSLPLPQSTCQALLTLLAEIHAGWWEHPRLQGDLAPHLEDVPAFVRTYAQTHFAAFVDQLGDLLSPQRRQWYERILAAAPLWQAHPVTLVHGDAHFWNFLYPRQPDEPLYLLDWAAWHVNLAPSDAAYMLGQLCSPERRARIEQPLVRHYHEQLLAFGVQGYSWEQCWLDYRLAIIPHTLWVILWQQAAPNEIWWRALENLMSAFEDLDCQELLP